MAQIKPFRGIRYNRHKVNNPGEVITPPYDVIDAEMQKQLHALHPYNSIRLEYGYAEAGEDKDSGRYNKANATLNDWLEKDILQKDSQKCFYLYEQHYDHEGKNYQRHGIMAAVKVEPYENRVVLPHEKTHREPKADRLALLKTTQTQFSPIFGLVSDPEKRIYALFNNLSPKDALLDAKDEQGHKHRIWALSDPKIQQDLIEYFEPRPILIADGHHRYETALNYSQMADLNTTPGAKYVSAVLVGTDDPGLLMLPTHRYLKSLQTSDAEKLAGLIKENFLVEIWKSGKDLNPDELRDYLREQNKQKMAIAVVTPLEILIIRPKKTAEDGQLALAALDQHVLQPLLKSGSGKLAGTTLHYSHDAGYINKLVRNGSSNGGFIVDAITIEEVMARSLKGEIMPQKSTYFYPKLPGGLVFYSLSKD